MIPNYSKNSRIFSWLLEEEEEEEEEEDLNYHLLPTRVYKLQTLITAITVGNGFTKRSKFRKF